MTTVHGERKQDENPFDEVYKYIINKHVLPDDYENAEFSSPLESERKAYTARSTFKTGDRDSTEDRKETAQLTEVVDNR